MRLYLTLPHVSFVTCVEFRYVESTFKVTFHLVLFLTHPPFPSVAYLNLFTLSYA